MKNSLILFMLLMIFSCTTKEAKPDIKNQDLIGKWKVIEQLADPGDGSGTFNPIESDRTIQFFSDGTVTINGDLCYMSSGAGAETSGTFEIIAENTTDTSHDGIIFPIGCDYPETKIYFDLPVSGNLILWYLCIEGCAEKFKKI